MDEKIPVNIILRERETIKEQIEEILNEYNYPILISNKGAIRSMMYDLLDEIGLRIQEMIKIDNQTLQKNYFNNKEEAKLPAQISKNILTLVLEMIKVNGN